MSAVATLTDPVEFAINELHFEPWSKQAEILRAVVEHKRTAIKAANAVGKSAVASALVPYWLAHGPGSIVISTSATQHQLSRVLWREVHRRRAAAPDLFAGGVILECEIRLAPDWYALGLSTDTPEAFQGHHAARVLVLVDEASGVQESIFSAIEGLLAGGDSRLVMLGNPLRTSGSFFNAFNRDRDDWHCITGLGVRHARVHR